MLKQKYYASGEFRVSLLAECQFADVSDNLDVNEQTVFLKLLSLIRGYLKLGAVVCGPPALDGQFDTGDFSSVVRRS